MNVTSTDIGALRRIGAPEIVDALALARAGRIYDLGLEINERMPQGGRDVFIPFSRAFSATPEGTGAPDAGTFSFAAEVVIGTQHTSTHIDALIHVQDDGRVYGGQLAKDVRTDQGWLVHGMETVPPIVGRSVLLDIPRMKGIPQLPDGYEITQQDLEEACTSTGVEIRSGDVVLVRTGKIRDFSDPAAFEAGEPGVGRSAAIWLHDQGMAILGTDTTGTEPLPFRDPSATTHCAMLVDRGVHLIENLYLEDLSSDGVVEAAFFCLPLRFTGATGSWVRPVAIT
jgi:kynurenine formamidase